MFKKLIMFIIAALVSLAAPRSLKAQEAVRVDSSGTASLPNGLTSLAFGNLTITGSNILLGTGTTPVAGTVVLVSGTGFKFYLTGSTGLLFKSGTTSTF